MSWALFFECYASFLGPGLFLENFFVGPEFRGKHIGRALFTRVPAIAVEHGCFGVIFNVLDGNQPAIDFYREQGAQSWDEFKTLCLRGDALRAAAG